MFMASIILSFAACNGEQNGLGSNELSDDLNSLMFSLDGVVYTLPVHFSELEANGWSPFDPDDHLTTDTLEPGDFTHWELIIGDQNILVTFTNLSEEVIPISESYITMVVLYERYNAQLILPGNIMIGSTYEDIITAHGEPNSRYTFEEPLSLSMRYSSDYFTLLILIESNLLTFMSMSYEGS